MTQKTLKPRLFGIGDIHGQLPKLIALMDFINIQDDDTFVFLGDYIDRGAYSYEVVKYLIEFKTVFGHQSVFLMGNHEEMLLNSRQGFKTQRKDSKRLWLVNGAKQTLASYRANGFNKIPDDHIAFFEELRYFHETETAIFTHATPSEYIDIDHQPNINLIWSRPNRNHLENGYRHVSGKIIVCGHTPLGKQPIHLGGLIIADTGGFEETGYLSAVDVNNQVCYSMGSNLQGKKYRIKPQLFPNIFDEYS